MDTFWFFWLRFRQAYDSAYNSDFQFSQVIRSLTTSTPTLSLGKTGFYAPLTGAKRMSELVLLCSRLHTLQTVQVKTSAFSAAAFWSGPPWAFLSFSCFCAFFCWDWNFWWPRAISNYSLRRKKKSRIIYIVSSLDIRKFPCFHFVSKITLNLYLTLYFA